MPDLVGEDFSKPPPKFDFDALGVTDGRVYFFAKGTDYDSSEANFRLHLSRYVEEHGGAYNSRTIKAPDGSIKGMEVRFVDPQEAAGEEPAPHAASTSRPEGSPGPSPSSPSPSPSPSPGADVGQPTGPRM